MSENSVKQPSACLVMADVRASIDDIDHQIMTLLSQRIQYIERAAHIKTEVSSIRDQERIDFIVNKRSAQAAEIGYSEDFIGELFNELIEYSIANELALWKKLNSAEA